MEQSNKIPALRTIAMPADTNPRGDIFGGWLLSQMDLAGSILAQKIARNRVATVGIEAMTFYKPVFVGDEVSCYTELVRVGNTSVTVLIESWARHREKDDTVKVTEGRFTYVSIDDNRKPVPIKQE
ncbi:MAG: acyl-CoA thioesterase [Micavibrio sp.]|nr:MAG: acyl-CoA thioesterase [Micavibrio sp.]